MNTNDINMNTYKREVTMEKKHVTARLEKSLVEKIKEMACKEGRSLNNMIERMLKDAIDEKK